MVDVVVLGLYPESFVVADTLGDDGRHVPHHPLPFRLDDIVFLFQKLYFHLGIELDSVADSSAARVSWREVVHVDDAEMCPGRNTDTDTL